MSKRLWLELEDIRGNRKKRGEKFHFKNQFWEMAVTVGAKEEKTLSLPLDFQGKPGSVRILPA